jgi:hypothetical protein
MWISGKVSYYNFVNISIHIYTYLLGASVNIKTQQKRGEK